MASLDSFITDFSGQPRSAVFDRLMRRLKFSWIGSALVNTFGDFQLSCFFFRREVRREVDDNIRCTVHQSYPCSNLQIWFSVCCEEGRKKNAETQPFPPIMDDKWRLAHAANPEDERTQEPQKRRRARVREGGKSWGRQIKSGFFLPCICLVLIFFGPSAT